MLCKSKRVVTVATDAELLNRHYYRRLWMAVKNHKGSRRDWPDILADTFRDFDGDIVYSSGEPFTVPFIDDVFDDPEMRWLSNFLKPDLSGFFPLTISRKLERLRLMDLYFRITHPKIAAHFSR